MSHPAWVCGLKLKHTVCPAVLSVTPCVGVWIETFIKLPDKSNCKSHTLRGCVDWNCFKPGNGCINLSHPAWVCGLKLLLCIINRCKLCHTLRGCVDWNNKIIKGIFPFITSHPAWVCGLKLFRKHLILLMRCHTLRGCVDWNHLLPFSKIQIGVTPCVGVWIETFNSTLIHDDNVKSHPAWVCGLKHN